MISVDTNVLVRLLTADDQAQAREARRLFEEESIYITKTVILETEWVLRYAYAFDAEAIARAFKTLLGLDQVTVEDSQQVAVAVTALLQNMDFADALHVAGSRRHVFATFDRKLSKRARAVGWQTVRLL